MTTSTGTGSVVLSNSPTLVTPSLGVATATNINSIYIGNRHDELPASYSLYLGNGNGGLPNNIWLGVFNFPIGSLYGTGNTAIGYKALEINGSASYNTALGNEALNQNVSGENSTAIGSKALFTQTSGTKNTAVGFEADISSGSLSNATAIGNGAIVNASNKIQLGNTDVTAVNTSGTITANGFVKSGGTSSQFLKADGSVDANTYLTGNQTITLTGNVTGTGTGTFTTTIGTGVVTNAMLAGSIAANKLIGTDIATVGTITSGTWSGTTIAVAKGGTGVTTSTGSGSVVLSSSPALTTPAIGSGGFTIAGSTSGTTTVVTSATATGTVTIPAGTSTLATTSNKLSAFGSTTSSELAGVISDETGSGSIVFGTSPTLTTPTLGAATATSINNLSLNIAGSGTASLTVFNGKTVYLSNSLNLSGTDATTMTFPSSSATIARTDAAQTFTGTQTFSGVISSTNSTASSSTSTGALVISGGVGVGGALNAGSTAVTSLVTPNITGGSGTTQSLTYKTTSGNGTTGADHIFQVGNNGATEAMRILNNGNIGIGTNSPTSKLNISGGGIKIFNGFANNNTARPSINNSTIGNYEIRAVGGAGAATQNDAGDDGFLRISAGGGTNSNSQSYIDLSGFSSQSDMNRNIVFGVAGQEKMRLIDNGKFGIGTNSPSTALHIQNNNSMGISGNPSSNSVPSIYVYNNNNSSNTAHSILTLQTGGSGGGKPYISFDAAGFAGYSLGMNNPTDQFIINTDWDFNVSDATKNAVIINAGGQARVIIPSSAGSYESNFPSGWGGGFSTYDMSCAGIYYTSLIARSDRRLKNSINNIDDSVLNKYLQLRPVSYFWNTSKSSDSNLQYGLIAQEVENIFPEMISTANDSIQTKSVNYQALHALSLKVIQIQQAEIDNLKKKQESLEARLLRLESKLNQ